LPIPHPSEIRYKRNLMRPISILVIDDEPTNLDGEETILVAQEGSWNSGRPYQIHYVSSGQMALEQLAAYSPDLILLDVMMPGIDGIEGCRRLKAMPRWQTVPIIITTALTEKQEDGSLPGGWGRRLHQQTPEWH
jgi:CheY-like chemotaxis protein